MAEHRRPGQSQNFIRRPDLVVELLAMTDIGADDLVVDIGAGSGIITRELLKRAGSVIAVEKDPVFFDGLLGMLTEDGRLQLVFDDIQNWEPPNRPYKVFANIPFNYTSDIVAKLTTRPNSPVSAYLIMQAEAALRFAGRPYQRDSQMSILLSVDYQVRIIQSITRESFRPVPRVDVVFAHFVKRPLPLVRPCDRQSFRDFVVYGYNRWAPTILEAYDDVFSRKQLRIVADQLHLADLRPSDLGLHQWLSLYEVYERHVSLKRRSLVVGAERALVRRRATMQKDHRTRAPSRNRRYTPKGEHNQ